MVVSLIVTTLLANGAVTLFPLYLNWFLDHHADSSLENADRLAAAREAIEANDAGTLQKCILSVDMETLSQEGTPLLELASEYGRTGCVKVLLEGGCDPNCRVSNSGGDNAMNDTSKDGSSPLHVAAKYGHLG